MTRPNYPILATLAVLALVWAGAVALLRRLW